MPVMGGGNDFMDWLGPDMSIKVLMCLEDPSDLVRASTVSKSWRQFGKLVELNTSFVKIYLDVSVHIICNHDCYACKCVYATGWW